MNLTRAIYNSPIGALTLLFNDDDVVYSLGFGARNDTPRHMPNAHIETSQLSVFLKNALDDYFNGELAAIDKINVRFFGTDFQIKAWEELRKIPHGKTISYQEQCMKIGSPLAVRAIGQANNKNPIALIAPCHRVIGKNGKMVGFGGGIDIKEKLLAHEAKFAN